MENKVAERRGAFAWAGLLESIRPKKSTPNPISSFPLFQRDQESNVGSSAIVFSLVPHVPSIARLLSDVRSKSVGGERIRQLCSRILAYMGNPQQQKEEWPFC
ncbi:hypothetical protein Pyn_08046 [Prunus yedoensis var. nudiflora]|uniref:Uncharacterized protein n=1 Tax=Prunus yedoensis var. nudiflora TaxID=2094558 RepID=A0A314Y8F1_PRUYE|nr:hypothetical protein Pyn_08046 [Prunus yedoensis var. nudiflora]